MSDTDDHDHVWIALHVEIPKHPGAEVNDYISVPRAVWETMWEDEQQQWIEQAIEDHVAKATSATGRVVDAADVPPGYAAS